MTNNLYIIARLTTNGPDYQGELHATPYTGPESIDVLTDEAMWMLEPEFPVAELVSDAVWHISDRTLLADVIWYRARFVEIERIWDQRVELEHKCYLVGLEMGFCRHRLQDVRVVQRIIEEMVQDQRINQQGEGRQQNNVTVDVQPEKGMMSRCPALSVYQRLTHKPRASYGHALGLLDW